MSDRIRIPSILLVGSAGKNSRKTTLACAILSRFARQRAIVGVKVTTVRGNETSCPRDARGCGVCSSLSGMYDIAEELDRHSGKDTARMLASGARQVFWLRAREGHLREGLQALLNGLLPGTLVVAESNTASRFLDPGVFLMVREQGSDTLKPSALEAMTYVDRQVRSDGDQFDLT